MRQRFSIVLLLSFILALSCEESSSSSTQSPWNKIDEIKSSIIVPTFRDQEYNIVEYGANEQSDCLPFIRKAVRTCSKEGGGKVIIPEGSWFVKGPIHLLSNVNLHIAHGAVVKFSTDPGDYLPVVLTRWEGMECMNYSPLIYALDQENIAITGGGTIDGQADNDHWWPWKGQERYGWKPGDPSQLDPLNRPALSTMNTNEVLAEERIMGEGHFLRPNFIQTYRCNNILIEGITIKNSPMWVINPVLCESVSIENVHVSSHGPNSDGCDPESCNNVLIKDCFFDTGDDCIALKSGRNQDGRNIGRPIENVVIQNCIMKDGHGGVVVGSEVSGGARNIYAENCIMDSPNLERAIRIKTNQARGGTIENLYFRNISVGEVKESVIRINMLYTLDGEPDKHIPVVQNIFIEDVTSQKSKYALMIDGYDEENPVNDVYIKDCHFDGVEHENQIKFMEGLTIVKSFLNDSPIDEGHLTIMH